MTRLIEKTPLELPLNERPVPQYTDGQITNMGEPYTVSLPTSVLQRFVAAKRAFLVLGETTQLATIERVDEESSEGRRDAPVHADYHNPEQPSFNRAILSASLLRAEAEVVIGQTTTLQIIPYTMYKDPSQA